MTTLSLRRPRLISIGKILLVVVVSLLLLGWLIETPTGLLGKADAIGYAVCHRIAERSFFLDDRQTPLCARCTGMYLGALLGLLYQLRQGKLGGMPRIKFYIVLGLLFVAFGVDGLNSYMHFFPNAPSLYQPQNYLRLITGSGMGLGLAAMLYPVFQQTLWEKYESRPTLHSWQQMLELLLIMGVIIVAVLSENPLLLYPLSVLASITILIILAMVYTMVWILLFKRDNSFKTWKDVSFFLIAGFGTALFQIAVMDAGRYLLTGTWNGFFSK